MLQLATMYLKKNKIKLEKNFIFLHLRRPLSKMVT